MKSGQLKQLAKPLSRCSGTRGAGSLREASLDCAARELVDQRIDRGGRESRLAARL